MSAYWDPLAELQLIASYCSALIPDRAQPGKSLGLLRGFLARDQILPEAAAGQVFPIRPAIGEGSGPRSCRAAAQDEITGSWPVVILLKALGIAGHAAASSAVAGTVMGRRVSRFKDVAEASLEYLNRKVEEAKSKPD